MKEDPAKPPDDDSWKDKPATIRDIEAVRKSIRSAENATLVSVLVLGIALAILRAEVQEILRIVTELLAR